MGVNDTSYFLCKLFTNSEITNIDKKETSTIILNCSFIAICPFEHNIHSHYWILHLFLCSAQWISTTCIILWYATFHLPPQKYSNEKTVPLPDHVKSTTGQQRLFPLLGTLTTFITIHSLIIFSFIGNCDQVFSHFACITKEI